MQKNGKRKRDWFAIIFIIGVAIWAGTMSGCVPIEHPNQHEDAQNGNFISHTRIEAMDGLTVSNGFVVLDNEGNVAFEVHPDGTVTVTHNLNLGGGLVTSGIRIDVNLLGLTIDGEQWGGRDWEVTSGFEVIFDATHLFSGGRPPLVIFWSIDGEIRGTGPIFKWTPRDEQIGHRVLTIKVVDADTQDALVDVKIEVFEEDEEGTPNPPPPPPVLTPTLDLVGPATANAPFILSWSGAHLGSCKKLGAWTGDVGVAGQETIPLPNPGTYNFSMECTGVNGTKVDKSVNVVVTAPPPPPAPTVTIASLASIPQGTSLSVSHNSANTSSCRGSSGPAEWLGSLPLFGSRVFSGLLAGTYTYTVECTGLDGVTKVYASTTTVVLPPVTTGFSGVITSITPGGPFVRGATVSLVVTVSVTNGDGLQHKLHTAYYDTTIVDVIFTSPVGSGTVAVPLPSKVLTAITDGNETLFNNLQVWSLANNPEGLLGSFPIVVTLN